MSTITLYNYFDIVQFMIRRVNKSFRNNMVQITAIISQLY